MLGRLPAFWKNVSTVLGGTALAQLIPIAVLPVFTRILPQEQLGSYFVWFGAVAVLTVVATGRFDMAVYTAKTKEQIRSLLAVALIASVVVAISALLLSVFWKYGLGYSLLEGGAGDYPIAWVLCAIAMANYQMAMAVCVYHSQFKQMALSKVALAGSIASLQLLLSLLGAGLAGLVYANLVMACAVTFFLMIRFGYSPFSLLKHFTREKFSKTLRENYRFPLFSMPSDFINSFAAQMPLFIIAAKYGSVAVAGYALVLRVLAGPIGLLANSVLAAFKDEAGRAYRELGNCVVAYRHTFRALVLLAIVPFSVLFVFGRPLVVWGFGDAWGDAGTYAEILAPMFFMKFIASPLSYTLYIANKQVHDLVWQIGLLSMTWVAFYFSGSLEAAITAYSVGYTLLYVIYLALSYWAAHGDKA